MTSKLTRERLEHYASLPSQPFDEGGGVFMYEVRQMARMALAAMDSEPVAFINGAWTLVYYRPPKESGLKIGDKLYRHAQQPVVPNDGLITELLTIAKEAADDADAIAYAELGNKSMRHTTAIADWECRAAMLNGGKS